MTQPQPQRTYIGPEEDAYNTPTGSHSRSNRRGKAICSDGVVRTMYLGIPDTFFTIPAHCYWDSLYCSGFVTLDDGEFYFIQSHKPD